MSKKNFNNYNNNNYFSFFNILFIVLFAVGLFSLVFSNLRLNISYSNDFLNTEETTNNENIDESDKNLIKQLYCQYDSSINFEYAQGGLRLFIPTTQGYINYNIVHSVSNSINADIWRIGQAYAYDDDLQNRYAITSVGAEWDMALRLNGRDDFIGGSAHGDEKYTFFAMLINGKQIDITSINELTSFTEITILENSIGYDPNDHTTQVLKHYKEYIINSNGIKLNQKVEWLNDYTLGSSYMAMMPPLKTLTDTFYTNIDYKIMPTLNNFGSYLKATKAVVYGDNLCFTMSVPKYPSLVGGDRFLLQDNGGLPYNKMYFVICNGASVSKGDIWETTTCYQISNS